jgi:hypothetical protein
MGNAISSQFCLTQWNKFYTVFKNLILLLTNCFGFTLENVTYCFISSALALSFKFHPKGSFLLFKLSPSSAVTHVGHVYNVLLSVFISSPRRGLTMLLRYAIDKGKTKNKSKLEADLAKLGSKNKCLGGVGERQELRSRLKSNQN